MNLDTPHDGTVQAAPSSQRWIHPAVMIALDEETERLGPRVCLALGRRHPDALAFFCTLPSSVPRRGRNALGHAVRTAFETVTDLGAREAAILAGHDIEDAIRVYATLFLGGSADEQRIVDTIEAVHRTAVEFFDATRIEVHVVALLPDLAESEDRQPRYATAYRQISVLDRLGDPARPLGLRDRTPTDFRWVLDCRTRAGAHAGGLKDVLEPVAETIALLLEGRRTEPIARIAHAADRLNATVYGRVAGYSSFGAAMLVHPRRALARLLAAEAALAHLQAYGRDHALFEDDDATDHREQRRLGRGGPDLADTEEIESILAEWADSVALTDRLDQVFEAPPPAPDAAADELDRFRARQARRFEKTMAELEAELARAVHGRLVARGLADADVALRILRGENGDDATSSTAGPVSLPGLRRRVREDLERFLGIRDLRARIEALAQEEAEARAARDADGDTASDANRHADGDAARDTASDANEPVEDRAGCGRDPSADGETTARRKSLERELRRREALLAPGYDLDELEVQLIAIADELGSPESSTDSAGGPSGPAEPSEAARARAPSSRDPSLRERIVGSVRSWLRRGPSRPAPPPLPTRPASSPASTARELVERLRWLEGYASVLDRALGALESHADTVHEAARYYEDVVSELTGAVLHRTNFIHSSLGPAGLNRYRERYLDALRAALSERDACLPPTYFRLEPPEMRAFEHPLNVSLEGFEAALESATGSILTPLLSETIADVLAGRTPASVPGALHNVARMLTEASEPLVRPASDHDVALAPTEVDRWVLADASMLDLLRSDEATAAVLERTGSRTLEFPDETAVVFISAKHGFPVQAVRKLLALRAEGLRDHDVPSDPDEPVTLESLIGGPMEPALRTLVLARRLGLVEHDGDRLRVTDELSLPGDVVEAVRQLTTSARARPAQSILDTRIDELLQAPDGVERLRAAGNTPDLPSIERRIILETLAEVVTEPVEAEAR